MFIHPGQCEAGVDQGREEAGEDDEYTVLKQWEDDLVHQLVQDDETLQEHEREGGEVEVDIESHNDLASNGKIVNYACNENKDQADLEANLCHVVRIEAAEIERADQKLSEKLLCFLPSL